MMLRDALTGLRDALRAADIHCELDAGELQLPGVWITLDRMTDYTLHGVGTIRARLFLIVRDSDDERALEALSDLYDRVAAVVPPTSDTEATLARPHGQHDLPALTFTRDLPA